MRPITFLVDDVVVADKPRPTRALRELAPDAVLVGGDAEARVIDCRGVHPLLAAVHIAFAEHRPLVLSPDAIWLTIASGLAQHVRLNAERLRSRLVGHAGRKTLELLWQGAPPRDPVGIGRMVDGFRDAIAECIGKGPARLFVCDFSTSTEVERIASEVVLMDAYSSYFDYQMLCICGIPEVTLLGTPEDYRKIRERIDVLCELELDFWRPSLVRIADGLIETAEGRPDREFWRGICKPKHAYGPALVTGWIARLYPYLRLRHRTDHKNPLLELPFDFVHQDTGVSTSSVPDFLSRAIVDVRDETCRPTKRFSLSLDAGLTHVVQDGLGRLVPSAGVWLREHRTSIHQVIERIRSEHTSSPAAAPCPGCFGWYSLPGEVLALYDHLASATLFQEPKAWRLRPLTWHGAEHAYVLETQIQILTSRFQYDLLPLFDLPGGRILGLVDQVYVVVQSADLVHHPGGPCGEPSRRGSPRDIPAGIAWKGDAASMPVVGRHLSDILTWVLDHGPDEELPVIGTLGEMVRMWW